MKIQYAISLTVCLAMCPLVLRAADPAPAKQPLAIPVNLANQAPGAIECRLTRGPITPILALAFSPDSKTLASAGYQEVLLWDIPAGKLARRIPANGCVGALAFLKDGQTLVIGEGTPGVSGAVRFLDLKTGKDSHRFTEPKDVVTSISISADGKLLAAASATEKIAFVWNLESKKLVTTIQGHSDRVLHVAFNPNQKFLVTSSDDNTAQVINTADWSVIIRFTEVLPVRGSAFHPDDLQVLLAVGNNEGSMLRGRKTDAPTFRRPISIGAAIPLNMAGPTKAGRVYVPCSDKTIRIFDIKNYSQIATLAGHQDWVHSVAFSPDEKTIASGSADGTIRLWSNVDNRPLATLVQFAPRGDEWLALTIQGNYATSTPAALAWKSEKITTPLEPLTSKLENPELVAKLIAQEKITPPPPVKPPVKPSVTTQPAKPAPATKPAPPANKK